MPLLSILGVLGLAIWSIYWDLRRRLPRHPPPRSSAFPAKSGKAVPGRWYLEGAVVALAAAWLMRYLSVRWGAWLGLAGYGAFVAGITLLAMHVARRLSDLQRDPEGE